MFFVRMRYRDKISLYCKQRNLSQCLYWDPEVTSGKTFSDFRTGQGHILAGVASLY